MTDISPDAIAVEAEKNDQPLRVPEAWFVGWLTVVAYGLVYAYEYGYLRYFGVPASVVSIDIGSMLSDSLIVFTALLPIVVVSMAFSPRVLVFLSPAILAVGLWVPAIHMGIRWLTVMSVFVSIAIALLYVDAFVTSIRKKSPLPIAPGVEQPEKSLANTSLLASTTRAFGIRPRGALVAAASLIVFAVGLTLAEREGELFASGSEWFLVNTSHPDLIILRRSGDRWVCGQLDLKSMHLMAYSFLPISDSTVWVWRHVGRPRPNHVEADLR